LPFFGLFKFSHLLALHVPKLRPSKHGDLLVCKSALHAIWVVAETIVFFCELEVGCDLRGYKPVVRTCIIAEMLELE